MRKNVLSKLIDSIRDVILDIFYEGDDDATANQDSDHRDREDN